MRTGAHTRKLTLIRKMYYIIDNNNSKKGPYSLEELSSINFDSLTLVWKKGMKNWVPASNFSELSTILHSRKRKVNRIIRDSPPEIPKNRRETKKLIKYNLNYTKRTDLRTGGIVLLIISILINFILPEIKEESIVLVIIIFFFLVRIISAISVGSAAREQNRPAGSWGFFAFLFPAITLIIIGGMNKLNKAAPTKKQTLSRQEIIERRKQREATRRNK